MANDLENALIVRMEASLAKFERQMKRAQDVAATAATGMEQRFQKSNTAIAASAERSTTALARFGRMTGNQRFVIQNTANQIGDMAVQMGSGTSAARALGQQLPQLLGGLGPVGAIMGTIAAIGIPLAAAFISMGGGAKDLADAIKEAQETVDSYKDSLDLASMSVADLRERFGSAAEGMRSVLDILSEIEARGAQRAIDGLAESMAELMEVSGDGMKGIEIAQFFDVDVFLAFTREAKKARGVARDLVEEFYQAQRALDYAGKIEDATERLEAQIAAQTRLLNAAKDLAVVTGGISEEEDNLVRLIGEGLASMIQLRGASQDAAGDFSAAAEAAGRIADELARAVNNAVALAAQSITDLQRAEIELQYRDDPVGRARAMAGAEFDAKTEIPAGADSTILNVIREQRREFIANAEATEEARQKLIAWRGEQAKIAATAQKPTRSAGGRGGVDPMLAEAERVYTATRTAAEAYAAELERLNALYDGGYISADTYARATKGLEDGITQVTGAANRLQDATTNMFTSIVDGSATAQEAVGRLLQELSGMAFNAAFTQLTSGMFGGGFGEFLGGIFGSAKGNAFSRGAPIAFAKGGVVNSPTLFPMAGTRTGLMGEAGPEAVLPLERGADGRLGVRSSGGGSVNVTYAPTINAPGATKEAVAALAQAQAQAQARFPGDVVRVVRSAQRGRML